MIILRTLVRAGLLLLAAFVPGCAKEPKEGERDAAAAVAEPALTVEQMERPSPSAAAMEAFVAICAADPARNPVARAAARRGFAPVPLATLREEMPGAAFPAEATAWRGPDEVGNAVLLWDGATATCELRARSVDPLVVDAEFAKLPQAFEEAGSSVMSLQAPPPARDGAPRTRQMLLVSPGGRPERARVLRLGDDGAGNGRGAVVLAARGVAAR